MTITVYLRDNRIEDEHGNTITSSARTVQAARINERATPALMSAMRRAGLSPALGEGIRLQIMQPGGGESIWLR